jgi:hypothetical protein
VKVRSDGTAKPDDPKGYAETVRVACSGGQSIFYPLRWQKLRESYRQYPLCRPEGSNRNEGQPEGAALVG